MDTASWPWIRLTTMWVWNVTTAVFNVDVCWYFDTSTTTASHFLWENSLPLGSRSGIGSTVEKNDDNEKHRNTVHMHTRDVIWILTVVNSSYCEIVSWNKMPKWFMYEFGKTSRTRLATQRYRWVARLGGLVVWHKCLWLRYSVWTHFHLVASCLNRQAWTCWLGQHWAVREHIFIMLAFFNK